METATNLDIGKAMTITLTKKEREDFRTVLTLWNDAGLPIHGTRVQIIHRGINLALEEYQKIAERQLKSIAEGVRYDNCEG